MDKTIVISKVNIKVIDFIKKEIADKKARHTQMMESINPKIIANLKSMKKIVG